MGRHTLRIIIQDNAGTLEIELIGRLAGPWVAELEGAWGQIEAHGGSRAAVLNLRNLTYADEAGKHILRRIFELTRAHIVTGSPLAEYLAQEIREHTEES